MNELSKQKNVARWGLAGGIRWLGMVLILETGLIHYLAAMSEFEEAQYMGYLFVANFLGALLAAYAIYRRQTWGWFLGAGVALGSMVGYAWSRTYGMPGMAVEEWFTPYGVVALAVEGALLLVMVARFTLGRGEEGRMANGEWRMGSLGAGLATGLLVLVLISYPAYRWDTEVTSQIGQHQHVGSLAEVNDTPVTSADELRDDYGVEVSLVASTAMDSFVDVRLKVVDAEKASKLLTNQLAIMVGEQELMLAPHIHTHAKPKEGRITLIFFPNRQKTIHSGTEVSLVFGKTRTESFPVR